VTKPIKSSKEVLKLKTDNLEKLTSLIQDVLDLVFNNTSIWVLSMIHLPVFSVWTSTSSLKDQEAELVSEEDVNRELERNTESQKIKLCNGLEENMMVPFTIDYLYHI
jgi:type II secretory pathway component HofQ